MAATAAATNKSPVFYICWPIFSQFSAPSRWAARVTPAHYWAKFDQTRPASLDGACRRPKKVRRTISAIFQSSPRHEGEESRLDRAQVYG